MSFPTSPTEGQIYNEYRFNNGMWKKLEPIAFNATAKASETLGVGWAKVSYTEQVSQSGEYDASLARFTAPVSGWYQFNATLSTADTEDLDGTFSFALNGLTGTNFGTVSLPSSGGTYDGRSISSSAYLVAGNYVEVYRYSTVATTTRGNDWCGNFSGHLIK